MFLLLALVCFVLSRDYREVQRGKRKVGSGTNSSVFFDQNIIVSGDLPGWSGGPFVGTLFTTPGGAWIYGMKAHLCFVHADPERPVDDHKYSNKPITLPLPTNDILMVDSVLYRLRTSAQDVRMGMPIFEGTPNLVPVGSYSSPVDYSSGEYHMPLYGNRDEVYAGASCVVSEGGVTRMGPNSACCLDYNSAQDPYWTPVMLGPNEMIRFQYQPAAWPSDESQIGVSVHGYFSYALTP